MSILGFSDEKYTSINLVRGIISLFSLISFYYLNADHIILILQIIHFLFSLTWLFIIQKELLIEKNFKFTGYVPGFMDVSLLSLAVATTGGYQSPFVYGYFVIVCFSALNDSKHFYLFTMVLSILVIVLISMLGYLRIYNHINLILRSRVIYNFHGLVIQFFYFIITIWIIGSVTHQQFHTRPKSFSRN